MASKSGSGTEQVNPTTKSPQLLEGSGTAARTAIPVACVQCRNRHLKCDGAVPCTRCSSEDLTCLYLKSRRGWKGPRRTTRSAAQANTSSSAVLDGSRRSQNEPIALPIDAFNSLTNSISSQFLLPSPPEISYIGNPWDDHTGAPTSHYNPSGPLTPPSTADTSGKGLISAFYSCFHPAHPFLPPQTCMNEILMPPRSHLELAVRFIGSLYTPSAVSSDYLQALQQIVFAENVPRDGSLVQALMLMAIGMHMMDMEKESAEVMRNVVSMACDLGLNRKEYAILHGSSSPVLEESWRRTWWEIFVLDGMFTGVNPDHYRISLFGYESDMFLPCEESMFLSGQVPGGPLLTLQDYDGAIFEDQPQVFSSSTYRIDAMRLFHKVCAVQQMQSERGQVDIEVVNTADRHLTSWWLHLPSSKRSSIDKSGCVDEVLFEAHMIAYACTIILHRPRSDLNSDEAKDVTTCISAHQKSIPCVDQDIHTAKALQAAKDISKLITLPSTILGHTPFFSCAVVMASVVFLSYWSFILSGDGDSPIKDHIKLNIGVLKRQGEVWPIAKTVMGQVQGVAKEIFQSRKAVSNGYTVGISREEAFQGLIEETDQQLGSPDLHGSFLTWSSMDDMQ